MRIKLELVGCQEDGGNPQTSKYNLTFDRVGQSRNQGIFSSYCIIATRIKKR